MTATFDGDQQIALPGKGDGIDHIVDGAALNHHGRPLVVEHAVPHPFCGLVSFIGLQIQAPVEATGEFGNGSRLD